MQINKIKFIDAVSYALDYLEIGIRQYITNHNRKVALISLKIGKQMNLSENDLVDLYTYAMLHDNGITNTSYNKISDIGRDGMEYAFSHCETGETNIKNFPFYTKRENIIKYHHESYDGNGFYGIKGNEIPLFSQIIALADRVEIMLRKTGDKGIVISDILVQRKKLFSDELCDIFSIVSKKPAFWLSLDDMFIQRELSLELPQKYIYLETTELLEVAKVLAEIIDAKSPFTRIHSQGLTSKIQVMSDYYGYDEEKKAKLTVAAYLHDIGKLVIPNEIIDKPAKLTESEFDTIKSHSYYTKMMLSSVEGFEDIASWASNHHEKLNGTGYPYGLTEKELSFESQLMACMDIYQALTEDRPYREPLTHEEAVSILNTMAEKGEINPSIVTDILNVCGIYTHHLDTCPYC